MIYDMKWYMIWYDIWYEMIYDMIWYDIWYYIISCVDGGNISEGKVHPRRDHEDPKGE
jgi:hypothetical protein